MPQYDTTLLNSVSTIQSVITNLSLEELEGIDISGVTEHILSNLKDTYLHKFHTDEKVHDFESIKRFIVKLQNHSQSNFISFLFRLDWFIEAQFEKDKQLDHSQCQVLGFLIGLLRGTSITSRNAEKISVPKKSTEAYEECVEFGRGYVSSITTDEQSFTDEYLDGVALGGNLSLLVHSGFLNESTVGSFTQLAAEGGNREFVDYCFKYKKKMLFQNGGTVPNAVLTEAVKSNYQDIVELCLEYDVPIAKDSIREAVKQRLFPILRLFVQSGCNVKTILSIACEVQQLEVIVFIHDTLGRHEQPMYIYYGMKNDFVALLCMVLTWFPELDINDLTGPMFRSKAYRCIKYGIDRALFHQESLLKDLVKHEFTELLVYYFNTLEVAEQQSVRNEIVKRATKQQKLDMLKQWMPGADVLVLNECRDIAEERKLTEIEKVLSYILPAE